MKSRMVLCLMLLLPLPVLALPFHGYIEGTAANHWAGMYAVQLTDGSVLSGQGQMAPMFDGVVLPVVQNLNQPAIIFADGSATLGNLGSLSWGTQPLWILPGDPSPDVAVLAIASGTISDTTLSESTMSFGFNSTLTAFFHSVLGGQILEAVRVDFSDGQVQPFNPILHDGPVFIDVGVPVALGTSLTTKTVSVPGTLLLFGVGMIGLAAWRRYRERHPKVVGRSLWRDRLRYPPDGEYR